jgi:hypothetical protein
MSKINLMWKFSLKWKKYQNEKSFVSRVNMYTETREGVSCLAFLYIIVTCLGSVFLYVMSFLPQCDLFGFFWHHLVTCLGFRNKELMWTPGFDAQLFILHLMQPRCYTSLATQNHCYNETRTRLTARSRSLLTASSLLGWFLGLHCWSNLTHRFWSACVCQSQSHIATHGQSVS